ncbi:MAG: hypothetical protein C4562_01115 [Actinobacteria bacterium]|nr:MAG: hypothetical protein C4562_01115 [Actinomycetota bacterium]
MLVPIKKAILEITRQYDNGDITQQEVTQRLEGVLTVLGYLEKGIPHELKELAKLQKTATKFIDVASRIYSEPVK